MTLPCTSGQYGRKKDSVLQVLGLFFIEVEITVTQGHIIKGSLRIRVEDKEVAEECNELVLARLYVPWTLTSKSILL